MDELNAIAKNVEKEFREGDIDEDNFDENQPSVSRSRSNVTRKTRPSDNKLDDGSQKINNDDKLSGRKSSLHTWLKVLNKIYKGHTWMYEPAILKRLEILPDGVLCNLAKVYKCTCKYIYIYIYIYMYIYIYISYIHTCMYT